MKKIISGGTGEFTDKKSRFIANIYHIEDEKKRRYGIMKYVCDLCGWEYDEEQGYPEGGIAPGTKWEDVPEDFECPLCAAGKDQFSEE